MQQSTKPRPMARIFIGPGEKWLRLMSSNYKLQGPWHKHPGFFVFKRSNTMTEAEYWKWIMENVQ